MIARLTAALFLLAGPILAGDGGTLIVLNKQAHTADLFNLSTRQLVATLPTGQGPHEGIVSADGKLAIVADYGTGPAPGKTLTVIDIVAKKVQRTISLGKYRRPHGLALLPDGKSLLVTVEAQQMVLKIDIATGKITGTYETGQQVSHMVVADPSGERAFVTSMGSGTVTAIDLAGGSILRQIATGNGPEGIDVTPDGSEVWIANREDDTITRVDARSLDIVGEIPMPGFPIRVKFSIDGRHALVSNLEAGELAVVDVGRRVEVARIDLNGALPGRPATETAEKMFGAKPGPIGILIHPQGEFAYVAAANVNTIFVVEMGSWKVVAHLPAGEGPDGMAFSPLEIK